MDVSIASKKNFIRWFLLKFNTKDRDSSWILNYFMSNDSVLEKVFFVERAERYKNAVMIPSDCAGTDEFTTYYGPRGKVVIFDGKRAVDLLTENENSDIYIELKFRKRHAHREYLEMVEAEEFLEEDSNKYSIVAENLIANLEYEQKYNVLFEKIDDCLMNGDRETFEKLSIEFKELLATKPTRIYFIVRE